MKTSDLRAETDRLVGAFERMKLSAQFISDQDNQTTSERLYYTEELLDDVKEIQGVVQNLFDELTKELAEEESDICEECDNDRDLCVCDLENKNKKG